MDSKCDSTKTIDENNLVTKSNRLIEAAYKLTEIEQKIVLTLISLVEPGDTKFRSFTFAIKDFIKLIGAKSEKRYRELENITATLLSKVHHIRFEDGLTQVQWLSRADYNYKQGTITLTLNEFLEPYLLDLKREFTSYQLKNVSKLKGHYAIRIYELLKQYERLKERMFDLDDLRHKLGTEDIYPAYANFKQRVLVPAQKQINQKSDIDIIFKEIKEGRSVKRIKFLVSSKNTIIQPLTIIEEVEDKQEIIDMDLQELTEEKKIKEEQPRIESFYFNGRRRYKRNL